MIKKYGEFLVGWYMQDMISVHGTIPNQLFQESREN